MPRTTRLLETPARPLSSAHTRPRRAAPAVIFTVTQAPSRSVGRKSRIVDTAVPDSRSALAELGGGGLGDLGLGEPERLDDGRELAALLQGRQLLVEGVHQRLVTLVEAVAARTGLRLAVDDRRERLRHPP